MSRQNELKLADQYLEEADKLSREHKYEAALQNLESARTIYQQYKNWEKWVEANNEIGFLYYETLKWGEGIELQLRVLETAKRHLEQEHLQIGWGLHVLANCYCDKGDYELAISNYQKANDIYKKNLEEDDFRIARIYNRLGVCHDSLGAYDLAIANFEEALGIYKRSGESPYHIALNLNSIGVCFHHKGDFQLAIAYHQKSLKFSEKLEGIKIQIHMATIFNNLGICFFARSEYERAVAQHEKALAIRKKYLSKEHPRIALSLNNLGICYNKKGDYDRGIRYHQEALSIRKNSLGNNHLDVAMSLNNLGESHYFKSDYELAIRSYESALQIWEAKLSQRHPYRAHGLINMGACYFEKGDYKLSIRYYQKALALRKNSLGARHPSLAECLHNLAKSHAVMGEHELAIQNYQEAISIIGENLGKNHHQTARGFYGLGKCYFDKKEYEKALQHYQKAIAVIIPSFDYESVFQNPAKLQGYEESYLFLNVLNAKAKTLNCLYEFQTLNHTYLLAALSTLKLATDLVGDIRNSYKAEGSKHILAENAAQTYHQAIETALKTASIFPNFDKLTQQIEFSNISLEIDGAKHLTFDFSEQSKAVLMLSNFKDNEAKIKGKIPSSLLEKEKQIKIELNYLEKSIASQESKGDKKDRELLNKFRREYFEQKEKYNALIEQFEKDYSEYHQLKYSISTASVQDLQNYLSRSSQKVSDTLFDDKKRGANLLKSKIETLEVSDTYPSILLSYHISEEKIYIFSISSNDYQITIVKKPSNFSQLIEKLQEDIQLGYVKEFIASATKLFDILLRPVWSFPEVSGQALQSVSKLIIIPHGELYRIPFDVLLNQHQITDTKNFTNLPYLIRDFEISYHYSATLLLHSHQRQLQTGKQVDSFFGLAPVHFGEKNSSEVKEGYVVKSSGKETERGRRILKSSGNAQAALEDLEETELEVKEVYQLFEEQGKEAIALFYDQANKQNLKEHIGGYKYVLISTHGFLQETGKNTLSGIHLAPVRGQVSGDRGQESGDRSQEMGNDIGGKAKRKMKEGAIQPFNNLAIEDNDYLLHTSETYHLNLNADLVVLSSCESGIGELKVGEGMMALNRGFLYAGAGNIVYSLFQVPQDSTSQLTQALFRYILEGENYGAALRKAKLELIGDEMMEPMDWSGFALVGG